MKNVNLTEEEVNYLLDLIPETSSDPEDEITKPKPQSTPPKNIKNFIEQLRLKLNQL